MARLVRALRQLLSTSGESEAVAQLEDDGTVTLKGRWTPDQLHAAFGKNVPPPPIPEGTHLRSMPQSWTRSMYRHAQEEGRGYASLMHLTERGWDRAHREGHPVHLLVRHPLALAISFIHNALPVRLAKYHSIHHLRDTENVEIIKVEDSGVPLYNKKHATDDVLGLRARFLDGDEQFPDHFLGAISPKCRRWLRDEFGYEGLGV